MAYAILVTRSRSFSAPVDTLPKVSCSDTRPPSVEAISSMSCSRVVICRSSGRYHAAPRALPRGIIVTLDQGAGILQNPAHGGVPRLVIGYGALLLGGYDLVLALETADDTVDGGEEVLTLDAALVVACGYEGRLVAYVCYVCARENRVSAWRGTNGRDAGRASGCAGVR